VEAGLAEVELDRVLLTFVLVVPAALGGGAVWATAARAIVAATIKSRLNFMTGLGLW
jgi:hypothetical protein